MDSYTSQLNGKTIVYREDGILFGNMFLPFSEMSDIVIKNGEIPVWQFTYKERRLQIPYSVSERDKIEPFIHKAIGDDLNTLLQSLEITPSTSTPANDSTLNQTGPLIQTKTVPKYSFKAKISGTDVTFSEEGFGAGNTFYSYSKISNITHIDGEEPAFLFDYEGKQMKLPYDKRDKDNLFMFFYRDRFSTEKQQNNKTEFIANVPKQETVTAKTEPSLSGRSEKTIRNETISNNNNRATASVDSSPKKKKSKTIICKHCGAEIAKSAKVCPHCGGKNKKPVFKRVWFWLLLIVLVFLILAIAGSGNQYKLSDDSSNMSEADYKSACEEVTYKELAKNADKYEGKKLKFTGQVQQVAYDSESGESEYLVAVTKDEYDFYDDNIYLYYNVGSKEKIIEEDIIAIYGEGSGEKSYTSVLGASITVPAVTAVYVDVIEAETKEEVEDDVIEEEIEEVEE